MTVIPNCDIGIDTLRCRFLFSANDSQRFDISRWRRGHKMGEKDAKKSDKKPIFKKWWFWVIIVVVLVAIGGGASNKNEPAKVGENSGSNVSNQETEEKTDFAVGDVISYKGKEITVLSVERKYDSNNEFYQPKDGKEFVKISIKIENKSEEKISYNSYDWEIQDSNGDIQDIDAGLQFSVDGALNSGDLAPGGKKSADLYFQVPKDDAGLVLHYKDSLWSDKTVNIKL